MIIDFDQIHVVSKIEGDRIFYLPLIKDKTQNDIISSIPYNNFQKASLRVLYTEDEVDNFLKSLPNEKPLEVTLNNKNYSNNLKDYLFLNDPVITGKLLIYLIERQKTSTFSKSDQTIYEQALNHLSNEISVIKNISQDKAKNLILNAITNK
jgi:RNA polymerase-interacting CarD/CdnL/TRCF family regulator